MLILYTSGVGFLLPNNYFFMQKIAALALFCILLFTTSVQAQEPGIRFGFQASPTISFFSTDDNLINNNGSNFPGLKLGLIAEKFFAENYAITSGIGFAFNQGGRIAFEDGRFDGAPYWPNADKGVDVPDTIGVNNFNLRYSIQYVEIPIGLKLRTSEMGYFRYYLQPHAVLGFRTNARGEVEGDGLSDIEKINIQEDVNPFAFSLGIGIGTEYSISSNTIINGGIFYQRGVIDATKDVSGGDDAKASINTITFRIAVML